jgi:hypothetical protein
MILTRFPAADLRRVDRAVDAIHRRVRRTAVILDAAGIPYAIIGGNAVAAWVSRIDVDAVRLTRDVDILLRKSDLAAATQAMEAAGFRYRHVRRIDMFLDAPDYKVKSAVHIIFANEKIKPDDVLPAPDVDDVQLSEDGEFRHISLEGLVRMKLLANRLKDQVHLQDMASVGLIDTSWIAKFPPPLDDRLRSVLESPEAEFWPDESVDGD